MDHRHYRTSVTSLVIVLFLFAFELGDDMESKAIFDVSAPSETQATSEVDPQLSALLYDMSQQVEMAMHSMVKMASEISESTGEIMEEMEKCKEYVNVKNKILEEEKDRFQKAAIAVIEFLNGSENI